MARNTSLNISKESMATLELLRKKRSLALFGNPDTLRKTKYAEMLIHEESQRLTEVEDSENK